MVSQAKTGLVTFLLALAGCSAEPAVDATAPLPVPIDNAFRHVLHSAAIGEDFVIDVALPHIPTEGSLPVIYVMDGNAMFPIVASSARLLQFGGEVPPAIVVGIGYVDGSPLNVLALRLRDMTPTADTAYIDSERQGPTPLPEAITAGGAPAFLDFIENDVKPFVAANYPVDAGDATLVGDSLGGMFALYTLFNRTSDYQRYVVGSPSLWWDNKTLFADEAAYADRAGDMNANVFLAVGGLEEDPQNLEDRTAMVSNLKDMARSLGGRGYANLRMTHHVFEDETHLSVIPATMSRGLREVFRN